MRLQDFINHIFAYCNQHQVPLCVLRNYQYLPQENIGNDIDLLCPGATFEFVRRLVDGLNDVCITGSIDRYYVMCIFLHGVEWGDEKKTIQIDFFRHLCWKGLPYLDKERVLDMSFPLRDDCTWLRIPSPQHEAIISLFSSYLVGGWIKDRYQQEVRKIFLNASDEVCGELSVFFEKKLVCDFTNSVKNDDRAAMMTLLPKIRRSLISTSLIQKPFASIRKIITYYFAELTILFSKELRIDISVLGPDGAGKTTTINHLLIQLQNSAKFVEVVHLRPKLIKNNTVATPITNPHAMPVRSYASSAIKLAYYTVLYIFDKWFKINDKRNYVLRIWDRYYHDILADPKRYRMGAPAWLVRLLGYLIPKPDIFLILDIQPEVVRARKIEVSEAENQRQFHAYRTLAKELPNAVLINANGTPEEVVSACEREIVVAMAHRLARRLGWNQVGSGSL